MQYSFAQGLFYLFLLLFVLFIGLLKIVFFGSKFFQIRLQ